MTGNDVLPPVVDADWLTEHLGEDDVVVADVRGPNAHTRAHLPGSIPLVVGVPGQFTDEDVLRAFAQEAGLRLRRHGITGEERLVLYDDGRCVSAASAAQVVELAGHPSVAVLVGGLAGWPGDVESGAVVLEKSRVELEPRLEAVPTHEELRGRLDDPSLAILDVRRPEEYSGQLGAPCDPRQGHIPGARNVEVSTLFGAPGLPRSPDEVRALVGLPDGADVVAYCHSGSRSALATVALRAAGYRARNYLGSWHEWSRIADLPLER
jgi:thiosulfate/3-mercaptopyruvate sulfurtransferase